MNVNIRKATLKDIPALEDLISDSVSVLGGRYYTATQIASALSYVFGVDTQLIIDGTYFIANVEDHIAGSGGWSKRKALFGGDQTKSDQIDPLLDPVTDAARIRAFYVHPQWARRGVGSRILQSCEDAARNAGFSRLELVATLSGEPLYLARGYKTAGPIDLNTRDGESLAAFRMEKFLR